MPVDKTHPEAGFIEVEPLVLVGLDLVWVIVGLVCVAMLFAFWVIAYLLNAILGGVSIFGFHPFTFAFNLVNAGMKASVGFLDSKVSAFGEWLYGLIMTLWRFSYVVVSTVVVLSEREIRHFTQNQSDITAERNRAEASQEAVQQVLQNNITVARQDLEAEINQLAIAETQALANLSVQEHQDFANLQAQLNATDPTLAATLAADVAQLQGEITGLGNSLGAQITHVADSIPSDLAQLQAQLQAQINAGTATAEQYANGLAPGIEAGAVASALAQLQPQLNNIQTDLDECLDPLCDTVTPNASQLGKLGQLLKDLEGLFEAGVLMALLVAAVEDPKGTAGAVTDVMGWVAPFSLDLVDVVGEAAGVHL